MATVPQKTLSWLYDVLKREYRDPNRTYSDLAQTLSRYPSLAPRTDVYTFENGVPALLVHYVGVLPVNFRGTTYRFPIALWIPHTYPYDAPMVYVTPTDDMLVRPGQHVSGDGRVYHHYLAHWREAWDRSNVVDFLSILLDVFAKEPPVMSKQQMSSPGGQRQSRDQPPPRPPLPPQEGQRPHPQANISSPRQSGPPRPPPKQLDGDDGIQDRPGSAKLGRYDAPPPLPPQIRTPDRPSSMGHQQPLGKGVHRLSGENQHLPQRSSAQRQLPPPQQSYPQAQPQIPSQWQPPQSQPPRTLPAQPQPQLQPYLSQYQINLPPSAPQPQAYNQTTPEQTQQHRIQAQPTPQPKKPPPPDLLSSPFDIPLPTNNTTPLPAPPIPRNPEKDALLSHLSHQLTTSLHSQIHQNASALPALHSQHAALLSTLQTLQSEIPALTALSSTLSANINHLQTSLSQASETITSSQSRAKRGDIPKVDDMLVPPTVVAKQLYDNVCEERGIEAGIWALQEGFVGGRVGSEVWARRTRELARDGFRRKWVVRKVARGMGLDGA